MSASSARDRNVLSTPYRTSASGTSLVRIALLTISPASPPSRISTVTPFAASNMSTTVSEIANESWEITTSLLGGAGDGLLPTNEQPTISKTSPVRTAFNRNKSGTFADSGLDIGAHGVDHGQPATARPNRCHCPEQLVRQTA